MQVLDGDSRVVADDLLGGFLQLTDRQAVLFALGLYNYDFPFLGFAQTPSRTRESFAHDLSPVQNKADGSFVDLKGLEETLVWLFYTCELS